MAGVAGRGRFKGNDPCQRKFWAVFARGGLGGLLEQEIFLLEQESKLGILARARIGRRPRPDWPQPKMRPDQGWHEPVAGLGLTCLSLKLGLPVIHLLGPGLTRLSLNRPLVPVLTGLSLRGLVPPPKHLFLVSFRLFWLPLETGTVGNMCTFKT